MHLVQVEYFEQLVREGERVDLMLKIARATAVGVYGKECTQLMEDTVNEYVGRIEGGRRGEPAPAARSLAAEYDAAERAFAGFDERMAKQAAVVYVPPPVGSMLTPEMG